MKNRAIVDKALCLLVLPLVVGVPVRAQDQPDFSGRWMLESPSQTAPDIPRVLSVRQLLVRTNVRGEAMKPFFKEINIDREFESGTRSETRQIGVMGQPDVGLRVRSGHATYRRRSLAAHRASMPTDCEGPRRLSREVSQTRMVSVQWQRTSAATIRSVITSSGPSIGMIPDTIWEEIFRHT